MEILIDLGYNNLILKINKLLPTVVKEFNLEFKKNICISMVQDN